MLYVGCDHSRTRLLSPHRLFKRLLSRLLYPCVYHFCTATVIMSFMLPHLHNGWQVDQAILSEEDRVVVIRFGHDWDPECMKMDETLYGIAEKVKNFAVIYLVSALYNLPW